MTVFLQSLALGLLLGGVYALAASGLTLIFGVMKVINIAHGAFLVLASFITYTLWDVVGIDPLLAIVITTPVVFAIGWATYKVVVSPIRSAPMASTVLLTFGMALVLEGAMGEIWGNNSTAIRPSYADESFTVGGIFLPKAQVYGGLIAVAVLVVLWMILTRTWLGRAIRAAASNPSSAQLVGIRTASVAALVFAIGIAAAGAGGAITGVLYPFVPGSHYQWIARLPRHRRAGRPGQPQRSGARGAAFRPGRDLHVHLRLALVGDRRPLRDRLRRPAHPAAGPASGPD